MSAPEASTLSDPRLSKDVDLFMYEPRTEDAEAHYNRDEIVADLASFYNFLPHVSTSTIHLAPPEGWSEITEASLAMHDIHKSPEAIDLLRHLPYIAGKEPWIMITAFVCDYRRVAVSPDAPEKPGWLYNAADKQWPAWTVQLTAGTDREGHQYILDTTDGTISRYCCTSHGQYPPTYQANDPRNWRDRYTDPETLTLKEWLKHWRNEYLRMNVLTVPPDYGGYGSPDTKFGGMDNGSDSYNYEEMQGMRRIYREYGWPDVDKYRKEACIQALKAWYGDFEERQIEQMQNDTRLHWERRGFLSSESPEINVVPKGRIEDEKSVTEHEKEK